MRRWWPISKARCGGSLIIAAWTSNRPASTFTRPSGRSARPVRSRCASRSTRRGWTRGANLRLISSHCAGRSVPNSRSRSRGADEPPIERRPRGHPPDPEADRDRHPEAGPGRAADAVAIAGPADPRRTRGDRGWRHRQGDPAQQCHHHQPRRQDGRALPRQPPPL